MLVKSAEFSDSGKHFRQAQENRAFWCAGFCRSCSATPCKLDFFPLRLWEIVHRIHGMRSLHSRGFCGADLLVFVIVACGVFCWPLAIVMV
jgi:hypothetical protein